MPQSTPTSNLTKRKAANANGDASRPQVDTNSDIPLKRREAADLPHFDLDMDSDTFDLEVIECPTFDSQSVFSLNYDAHNLHQGAFVGAEEHSGQTSTRI